MYLVLTESELKERIPLADGLGEAEERAIRLAEHSGEDIYIVRCVQRLKAVKRIEREDLCQD